MNKKIDKILKILRIAAVIVSFVVAIFCFCSVTDDRPTYADAGFSTSHSSGGSHSSSSSQSSSSHSSSSSSSSHRSSSSGSSGSGRKLEPHEWALVLGIAFAVIILGSLSP